MTDSMLRDVDGWFVHLIEDGYAVHTGGDRIVVVLRAAVTNDLWCRVCERNARRGCPHISAAIRFVHRKQEAA